MINKMILGITFIIVFTSAVCCNGGETKGDYETVVTFKLNKTIKFPDFRLTFTGERQEISKFPNGNSFTFTYFDFTISNKKYEKKVSWTAGTGDIAPINFEFNGMKFSLELRFLEKKNKKLDDDELVITKL
jgi:hypothetical protein